MAYCAAAVAAAVVVRPMNPVNSTTVSGGMHGEQGIVILPLLLYTSQGKGMRNCHFTAIGHR